MTTVHFRFGLVSFVLFVLLLGGGTRAAEPAAKESIAILALSANAGHDLSYLQAGIRNMLASRLAVETGLRVIEPARVDRQATAAGELKQQNELAALGKNLQADYLLAGTLTAAGQGVSLEVKLYPVSNSSKPVETYNTSAATEEELLTAVDRLVLDIATKSFAKGQAESTQPPPQAASGAPPAQQPGPASEPEGDNPAYRTAHPDRQFMGTLLRSGSPVISLPAAASVTSLSQTQALDYPLQGLAVGDLDGDGKPDMAIAGPHRITAYHLTGSRLEEFGRIELPSGATPISLDLADLNGNGKAEMYVTCVAGITPSSFGAEWQGRDFAYLFHNEPWYMRIMQVPGMGPVLAGQRGEAGHAFATGIYHLSASGGAIQPLVKLGVPDFLNLYDFSLADLDGDGKLEVIALDATDHLQVLQPSGTQLWKSEESYGGSLKCIGSKGILPFGAKGCIYLHSPILTADVNHDQLPEVIVGKNLSASSLLFNDEKDYTGAELHVLAWNGKGFNELWHTQKLDGYLAAYQLSPDRQEMTTLYVGLVANSNWLHMLSDKGSTVRLYPLELGNRQVEGQKQQPGQAAVK